jgi:hypothetical protein
MFEHIAGGGAEHNHKKQHSDASNAHRMLVFFLFVDLSFCFGFVSTRQALTRPPS